MNLKQQLFNRCQEFVQNKLNTIEQTIQSNKNALNTETKSSAGDKHETGRAMLQLEMEKAGQQLVEVKRMQDQLGKIDFSIISDKIRMGSLVTTNSGVYFIAISKGQIKLGNDVVFALSSQSPIGNLLLGKGVNDVVEFRNQKIKILEVI